MLVVLPVYLSFSFSLFSFSFSRSASVLKSTSIRFLLICIYFLSSYFSMFNILYSSSFIFWLHFVLNCFLIYSFYPKPKLSRLELDMMTELFLWNFEYLMALPSSVCATDLFMSCMSWRIEKLVAFCSPNCRLDCKRLFWLSEFILFYKFVLICEFRRFSSLIPYSLPMLPTVDLMNCEFRKLLNSLTGNEDLLLCDLETDYEFSLLCNCCFSGSFIWSKTFSFEFNWVW